MGVATILVALTSCGGSRDESRTATTASDERVLNVYNWADYIGESTIRDFEARTGIKVTYDVYDSSEVLETKLMTGHSGYDVVVPSNSRVSRLIDAGTLQKIEKSKLKNLANMDPQVMKIFATVDPGNEHTVPYLWGTTGIGYNPDRVEKALGTRAIDSLSVVFDPAIASKLAKCGITMLDAPETIFELAFIYLGLDPNSQRREDLAAAEVVLARVRPFVRYFHSSQFVNDLASGEVCVSIGWSGAIQQARARGAQAKTPVDVIYVIPKEGAPLWIDAMAIPADAPHPANAHAFIDYVLEPKVMAGITNAVRQANGNRASLPFVDEALRNDPTVFPTNEVLDRLHLEQDRSPDFARELTRAWTRFRTGK
jgi:putrescine transport system substrate-binding protein